MPAPTTKDAGTNCIMTVANLLLLIVARRATLLLCVSGTIICILDGSSGKRHRRIETWLNTVRGRFRVVFPGRWVLSQTHTISNTQQPGEFPWRSSCERACGRPRRPQVRTPSRRALLQLHFRVLFLTDFWKMRSTKVGCSLRFFGRDEGAVQQQFRCTALLCSGRIAPLSLDERTFWHPVLACSCGRALALRGRHQLCSVTKHYPAQS